MQASQDERLCQAQAKRQLTLHANGVNTLAGYYGQEFHPIAGRQPLRIAPLPVFDIDPVPRMLEENRISDACMRAKGYTLDTAPARPEPKCNDCPAT